MGFWGCRIDACLGFCVFGCFVYFHILKCSLHEFTWFKQPHAERKERGERRVRREKRERRERKECSAGRSKTLRSAQCAVRRVFDRPAAARAGCGAHAHPPPRTPILLLRWQPQQPPRLRSAMRAQVHPRLRSTRRARGSTIGQSSFPSPASGLSRSGA